ncbi:MAG: hypothetical protein LBC51_01990 [Treponema sp.]|jgi:hypothetical protein|nr:hypothetical protein [Treponema sp.]
MSTPLQKKLLPVGLLSGAILAGCAGEPPELPVPWIPPQPAGVIQLYQVLDYKTQALGKDIPEWVNRYESEGIPGIEKLPQYEDTYMFISEIEGANFQALQQWTSGFDLSKDFSRLVASRIQDRMTKSAASYPEAEYGRFFEALIKAAHNTMYTGGFQADDFWVLKQYFQEDGVTPHRNVYNFLIMVGIHKTNLQTQIKDILDSLDPISLTKAQALSVSRLKESFFDLF